MRTEPMESLDSLLAKLSGETWERLRDAMQLSVSFGEETVTDLLALDINRHGLTTTTFDQTTKPEEAVIGADYEWWVGHDSIGWIRLLVQAKKLRLGLDQYNFRHTNKSGFQQIDQLETCARKLRALPTYCLYNYSEDADEDSHWRCEHKKYDQGDLGCTLVSSKTVRRLIRGQKNFNHLHRYGRAFPWRCLASCQSLRKTLWENPAAQEKPFTYEYVSEFGEFPCFYSELPSFLQPTSAPLHGLEVPFNDTVGEELYAFGQGNRAVPRWVVVFEFQNADLG